MISVIVSIAVLGLIVYLLTSLIPMPEPFKRAIYIVAGVGLCLYLLRYFGLWSGFDLPRRR
jgi:hypothetical protein